MSYMRKIFPLLFLMILPLVFVSCGDDDDNGVAPVDPGQRWTIRSVGTNRTIFDVVQRDTLYVAVGQSGTVLTSTDGTAWTTQESGIDVDLFGITANADRFVAVGNNGYIVTSTDGLNWTTADSTLDGSWYYDVTWSGTHFVAVGRSGLVASSADGLNWEVLPSEIVTNLYGIVFAEDHYTVVGAGFIFQFSDADFASADTIDLDSIRLDTNIVFYDIAYSDVDTTYMAVGQNGSVFTSDDDTTWVERLSGTKSFFYAAEWTGTEFVAAGENGLVIRTTDLATWQLVSTFEDDLRGLYWDGTSLIAVGVAGSIATSSDGSAWATQPSGPRPVLNAVTYYETGTDTSFVAVGDSGVALVSSTGDIWTRWPSSVATGLNGVAASNAMIAAVGAGGTVVTSSDGVTWTGQTSNVAQELFDIDWSGNEFVAVGDQGTIISSTDGVGWTDVSPAAIGDAIQGVSWTGTQFVAVGAASVVLTSPTGASWTEQSLDTAALVNLTDVASGDGVILAVSNGGLISRSTDGSTWETFEARPGDTATYRLRRVVHNGIRWVAVGSRNAGGTDAVDVIVTLFSDDGFTWQVGAAGIAGELHGVTFGNGRFVTVGGVDIGDPTNVSLVLTSP